MYFCVFCVHAFIRVHHAGVRQVGMVPKRRTIIQFDPADVAEEFKTAFAGPGNTFDREKYLAACSTWYVTSIISTLRFHF